MSWTYDYQYGLGVWVEQERNLTCYSHLYVCPLLPCAQAPAPLRLCQSLTAAQPQQQHNCHGRRQGSPRKQSHRAAEPKQGQQRRCIACHGR